MRAYRVHSDLGGGQLATAIHRSFGVVRMLRLKRLAKSHGVTIANRYGCLRVTGDEGAVLAIVEHIDSL